eukprot:TRINITY_DN24546_c0_g1_i1.p3 TRINITY_DN24546_c0_g1~~TRINITY_DN24546_c0_g1_i1.p3  ORF type:complete len:128 (+),score=4.46 TRINITY_DN24546_c0_g1_i1:489-872(+)
MSQKLERQTPPARRQAHSAAGCPGVGGVPQSPALVTKPLPSLCSEMSLPVRLSRSLPPSPHSLQHDNLHSGSRLACKPRACLSLRRARSCEKQHRRGPFAGNTQIKTHRENTRSFGLHPTEASCPRR